MSSKFDTRVAQEDDAIVIYVSGEIDISSCAQLRDAIEPNMGPRQTIILDLSEVEFMDSSSLSILVQARGALTDGGSLRLRNPSVAAHRLLSVAGAEALLDDNATQRPSD
jgi:anti-sigma B factor antagonist